MKERLSKNQNKGNNKAETKCITTTNGFLFRSQSLVIPQIMGLKIETAETTEFRIPIWIFDNPRLWK